MFESKVPVRLRPHLLLALRSLIAPRQAWKSRGYKPKFSEDVERAAQGQIPGRGLRVADDDTSDKVPEKSGSQNDL